MYFILLTNLYQTLKIKDKVSKNNLPDYLDPGLYYSLNLYYSIVYIASKIVPNGAFLHFPSFFMNQITIMAISSYNCFSRF